MVDWCHLGDLRFTDPFYEQTIGQAMSHPFNLLFRQQTPLGEIRARAVEPPELKLRGFIFHMSRCGSTVITQMLAAIAQNVVLSEPAPIDNILRIPLRLPGVPEDKLVRCLRGMVAALGRRRNEQERNLIVKLDAWHILLFPLLRRAFPDVPWIFVYRDPLAVLGSLAQSRPRQMIPNWIDPALLGAAPAELCVLTPDAYAALVLERYCLAAIEHNADGGLLVEYGELAEATATRVLAHFGLRYGDAEIGMMRAAAGFDAKKPGVPFRPDNASKRESASEEMRGLAASRLEPLYTRLDPLRLAAGQGPRA